MKHTARRDVRAARPATRGTSRFVCLTLSVASSLVSAASLAGCESVPPHAAAPAASVAPVPRTPIEEQAARAEAASRPGERHAVLDSLAGRWMAVSSDVAPDGAESEPRSGTAELAWVLGRRYLTWHQTLELKSGVRHTQGYLGFDEYQREYQLLMVSDLSTGMGVARGTGDPRARGIRFVLDIPERGTGGVRRAASVLRFDGRDAAGLEMFVLEQLTADAAGNERVVRRTRYRRAGGS